MIDEALSQQIADAEKWVQNREENLKAKKQDAKEAREELNDAVFNLRQLVRKSMGEEETL